MKQKSKETQNFGSVIKMPLGLSQEVCKKSVDMLNQVLADTMTLRDMYKKHHWQLAGPTFYQLHLLFDKHYSEQDELIDTIAERIQTLGGISIAMSKEILETTTIPSPPKGREDVYIQIQRLLDAHEIILKKVRLFARKAADIGDDGSNDLLISDVLRTNEKEVWFVFEHSVNASLLGAK